MEKHTPDTIQEMVELVYELYHDLMTEKVSIPEANARNRILATGQRGVGIGLTAAQGSGRLANAGADIPNATIFKTGPPSVEKEQSSAGTQSPDEMQFTIRRTK